MTSANVYAMVTRSYDLAVRTLEAACRPQWLKVSSACQLPCGVCLGGAVLDSQGLDLPGLMHEATSLRERIGAGPLVVLAAEIVSPSTAFELSLAAADVLDRLVVDEAPLRLNACLEGHCPGVRHLHAFCREHALSPMETSAVLAACAGLGKVETADELGCSLRTLEAHWSRIFRKIRVRCTSGVIALAHRYAMWHARPRAASFARQGGSRAAGKTRAVAVR
jgi:DNA-binding CsgD family transcriptional regulator